METIRSVFTEHIGTVKGVTGLSLSTVLAHVAPILSVVVLLLTIWNLALEIRKKSRKED